MNAVLVLSILAGGLAAAADPESTPRRPHPLAPSINELSPADEEKLDAIIDRFMSADIGTLKGAEAKAAVRAFNALGEDAIPALIRGLNRAARIEHSCPALVIAKKLDRMLVSSDDERLLEFARDEIGADVGKSRHQPVLQDLRVRCSLRRSALSRRPEEAKPARVMTLKELFDSSKTAQGPRLKAVLTELEQRPGGEATARLGLAARTGDDDARQFARTLLDRRLSRSSEKELREFLTDDDREIRKSAVRVAAVRAPRLIPVIIALLNDDDGELRTLVHETLIRLAKGEDFGPALDAPEAVRMEAQSKWRMWFASRQTQP